MERVARTLAVIHNQLSLPDDYAIPLPDLGVELQTRPVFVHGDFSTENIFYRAEGDELVVIDWSVTDWLTDGIGTQGPRYVDLTILLQSLFASRPFGPHPIPDPASLGRIFLEVYCQEVPSRSVHGRVPPLFLRASFPFPQAVPRANGMAISRLQTLLLASAAIRPQIPP